MAPAGAEVVVAGAVVAVEGVFLAPALVDGVVAVMVEGCGVAEAEEKAPLALVMMRL